ncbi:DUF6415 family natural product biosynthesis protein [Streptomyces lydicus]|uniref:DUF6415 family natural product biosynthesis protein n=1 Tax=Streptomyces lydicus TaxID=47763 RepID=UPI0037BE10B5
MTVLRRKVRCPSVRSPTVSAAETVALVLIDSVPLPASQTDVDDLVERLRTHIVALTGLLVRDGLEGASAKLRRSLVQADELRRREKPPDCVGSRIHLVRLAESVQGLLVQAATDERALAGPAIDRPSRLDRSGVTSRWAGFFWGSTSHRVRWGCHR